MILTRGHGLIFPLKNCFFWNCTVWWLKGGGECVEGGERGAASFIVSAPVKKLLAVSITSSSALLKLGCFQMCQPVFFFFFFFYRLVKHNTADTLRQHHLAHPPPPPPPPPPPAYRSITSGHLHLLSLISLHTHASAPSSVTLHATVRLTSSWLVHQSLSKLVF